MKLLKRQYQDILHVLDGLKISQEKLSLVKIKGRIRVLITGVDSHFEFFRRKSIAITQEDHQWQHVEHYELNISGKYKNVSVWSDVIMEFKLWLKSSVTAS